MTKLVDTHCHLDFPEFDADRDDVIKRAREAGIENIINVASSLEGSRRSVAIAGKYDCVYASVGIHPHDAKELSPEAYSEIKALSSREKVVAIGEVGLDYYRNLSPADIQQKAFRGFLSLAKETGLPLIIHCREAREDLLKIMRDEAGIPAAIRGVVHCFPADAELLDGVLDLGMYVSFTCNITFKTSSALRSLVEDLVPMDRILVETDAPYLAPEGMRGKRNEPAFMLKAVEEIARLKGLKPEDVARVTTLNCARLFGVGSGARASAIVYPIRNSLYINLTNRCSSSCAFCVTKSTDFVMGHNLKLSGEPSAREVVDAVGDPKLYDEVVFCGYGEPTLRLDCLLEVARELKKKGAVIRLTTNGHGNMINKRPIVNELVGLIDRVSVSLNAPDEDTYNRICKPAFGPGTYAEVKKFIAECRDKLPRVEVTCVDYEGVDMKKCEKTAIEELKVGFRPRRHNVVG
ncbi:MAG TPA: YchF/TatD family DNA exonuclease [Candidatus Omnitrophota bacterium]|nr:YchF/TatD family DNA exonuclease [Candidatus Omnitrophota bacterium]HOX09065.1 YchF/TatD family DNA exonuclease [Candidatus Omnitrophota bacterium]HPN66408.1 YchF/TatD family DNA exonuclease [Candidatus Omnitrophota bacterium]